MKLLTKTLEKQIPPIGSQAENPNPKVYAKFFTPWSHWTWYVTEYDPETRICFGYVQGIEDEWGSFSLEELEEINGPLGLKIERDLYFTPKPVKELL